MDPSLPGWENLGELESWNSWEKYEARGGGKMNSQSISLGNTKGKPPEADSFGILFIFLRETEGKIAGGGISLPLARAKFFRLGAKFPRPRSEARRSCDFRPGISSDSGRNFSAPGPRRGEAPISGQGSARTQGEIFPPQGEIFPPQAQVRAELGFPAGDQLRHRATFSAPAPARL